MKRDGPLHIAFAPYMAVGLRTQWENMKVYLQQRTDIHAHVVEIDPYKPGGILESLPLVPAAVKGNLRSTMRANALFRFPRLDALWIHNVRSALPFLLSKARLQHTSVIFTTDSTSRLQESFGGLYPNKVSAASLRGHMRDALDNACLNRITIVNPWSEWAARSLRMDHHIPADRLRVIPPGIDLDRWPYVERRRSSDDVTRLLFVGGDFKRKGGDLLLDVFARRLQGQCELHLVTRDDVPARPGVHIYRDFGPNDPGLRDLYARCDVFVLPTRADCFSLASMEAMATGLPVITTAVGGIPEIVAEGRSGFLIAPDDGAALAQRIDALAQSSELCATMGMEARRIVEERFDAARNTSRLLDTIIKTCR